jgi:hypothetical protein
MNSFKVSRKSITCSSSAGRAMIPSFLLKIPFYDPSGTQAREFTCLEEEQRKRILQP